MFHLNKCIFQSGIYVLVVYFVYILIAHTFIFVAFWLSIAKQEPWTHINLGSPLMTITPSTIFDPFKTHSLPLSPSLASKCLSLFNMGVIFLLSFFVFTQMLMNIFEEQSIMNEHNCSFGCLNLYNFKAIWRTSSLELPFFT